MLVHGTRGSKGDSRQLHGNKKCRAGLMTGLIHNQQRAKETTVWL